MTARGWIRLFVRLAALAAAGTAVFYGTAIYRNYIDPALQFHRLTIIGVAEGSAGAQEVQSSVQAAVDGKNFFLVRLDEVKAAVEDVSWVKSASVERAWPDGMRVTVRKHEPVAVWEDGRLVSTDGVLFVNSEVGIERISALPIFSGDASALTDIVQLWGQFQVRAREVGLQVKTVNVSILGSWRITLESEKTPEITVELGRSKVRAVLVDRFDLVAGYFHKISDMMQGYPVYVDARYRSAFAARLPDQDSYERWEIAKGLRKPEADEEDEDALPGAAAEQAAEPVKSRQAGKAKTPADGAARKKSAAASAAAKRPAAASGAAAAKKTTVRRSAGPSSGIRETIYPK